MIISICRADRTFVKIDGRIFRVFCWGVTDRPEGKPPGNVVPLVYKDGRLIDANNLGTIDPPFEEEPGEGQ